MNKRRNESDTYLNTAACGLVPEEIAEAGISFYQGLEENASQRAEHWRDEDAQRIRKTVANFLDAPESNVALIPSFSYGMNAVVQSLTGTEKVLLYERDYPSLINPFKVNNFDISWIPANDEFYIDPDFLQQKLKSRKIDLLAISHVQWLLGMKINLNKVIDLCHQNSVPVIVDATQSLGAMPISIGKLQPDVFISSNYKWMNAGFGTGTIYISDNFLKQYPPVFGGVNSYSSKNEKTERQASVLDLEPGHKNMAGFSVLEAAILDKQKRGLSRVEENNKQLTEKFIQACPELSVSLIGPATMENRSAIVVLKDENDLGAWLKENNFSVTLRNDTIRLSFHYYNTLEDVDRLIDCIQSLPDRK